LASPWKLGEREGALLQALGLGGVWDVRWPHGEERSSQRPEASQSPISHIQTGQGYEVLQPLRQGLEDGCPLGGLAARQGKQGRAWGRWEGDRGDCRDRPRRGHDQEAAGGTARETRPV